MKLLGKGSACRLAIASWPAWIAVGACSAPADDAAPPKQPAHSISDAALDSALSMIPSEASIDRAPASEAGPDGTSVDAGPQPYVKTEGGPFGIAARPSKQTCIAPAKYDQPTALLSATGCFDPKDPKKPAPGLIPYDVNSPLWSDGADKQRFMALPDGALIHVKLSLIHI